MPAIPLVIDAEALRRGLTTDFALATRSLHTVGHVLLRRGTDNHIAEVVAVGECTLDARRSTLTSFCYPANRRVAAIAISMGLLLYWGITKQGSCDCSQRKK